FGGIPHFSVGSIPAVAGGTVTINGLSKAFAMTVRRVGYAAAAGGFGKGLIRAIDAVQGRMTSWMTSFVYPASRSALTQCSADRERFRAAFERRAGVIYGLVCEVPGLRCVKPTGAFYVFPDASAHFGKTTPKGARIGSSGDFAMALLEEGLVAAVPGEEFG